MTFNKLNELLEDNVQLRSLITNISTGKFESPYLMNATVNLLSDQSPYLNIISDKNKISLAKLVENYFNSCWGIYIDDLKLDILLKTGKMELYKVDAPNGLRFATVNEIASGVLGLISEPFYPAGEQNYKRLSLLQWTFTGNNHYFREAGYKLTYEGKEVKESLYDMIQICKNELFELLSWVESQEFESSIELIKKMKRKGFKYASYEKDEIEESITIKQLIYNIDKTFPRNSSDIEYRRAIALVIKGKQNFKNLSPMDISFLRKVYIRRALSREDMSGTNIQLKNECEQLLSVRYSGKIDQNHFVYKIITTLKGKNYRQCSDKQYDVIKKALEIINKDKENTDSDDSTKIVANIVGEEDIDQQIEKLNSFSGETLADISDAIGNGLIFEEEGDYT